MDQHIQSLGRLCRLCGKRCMSSVRCTKRCSDHAQKLLKTFQVNVHEDEANIHPPHMCHRCYCFLFHSKTRTAVHWPKHQRTGSCFVCTQFMQQSKPGRKKKCQTRTGRPRAPPAYSDHFNNLRPGPTIDKGNIHQFTALSNTADVKCRLCNQLLDNAVETPCMHLFCCECLIVHFKDAGQSVIPCPTCQAPVHYRNVTSPREYFASLYSSLAMQCTVCNILVTLGDVKLHICRGVPRPSLRHVDQPVSMHDHRYASQLPNDAISTVDQSILTHDHGYASTAKPPSDVVRILHRPLTAPVTPQMEELGTHILKTKLAQSEDRFLVKYKTGGLPLTLVCIPQARKSSKDAASLSVRNRSKILDKIRGLLSMDAKELQQQDELKLSSMKDELESILKDLKLNSIRIPAMKLLAVKTHLGISWTRIRELKKWLKGYNILTEGENVLRRQQNEVIADNLITDSLPLSFRDEIDGGVVIQQAPYVGVKCLVAKIKQQLDQYQKYQELTWHEGIIPHDEIWVKIGGDKGGGTFKQMIQIGNVKHPNSLRHTIIMSVFAGEDTRDNLKTGLQRFRLQVPELQSSSWQGCKFRLFMFGDYEYICRVYGITGANGRHCCLYCDITKDGMRLPLAERPALQQRSLETLTYDLQRFRAHGAHLTKAKEFNNVIDEPMFAIPLTQVCPPGLHISLGLYLKHFNSFEGACHDLDMEVAAVLAEKDHKDWDSQVLGSRYQTLISVLKQARCLEQQARALDEELKLMEEQLTDTILTSEEESTDMQDYISATTKLVKRQRKLFEEANALRDQAALKPGQGPLAGQLDITLQEFRVKRQAFDGKSFVGNHVHKCCKKENIKLLTDALVIKTQQVCPSLVPAAASIAAKYAQLFHLFGTCHRMYNSASLLDDSAIDALDQAIKDYMDFFRGEFPSESIPPKMHLLEDHVMPWIRRWGFGLGFHGEQGAALHLHDISITSLNWVIKNATYKADLYFCVSTDAAGSLQFEFFSVPPTVKESSCTVLWQSVSLARKKQGAAVFDEWLFNKMSMWTDDDPKKVYPNSTAAWQKFESSLGPVYDLVRNIGVFEPYLWQAMTEFSQDNVQYMEIRGLLPPLKTSNGTQLSRNYTMQKYATIFDKFVSAYPGNFSGAKYIFSSKRHVAEEIVKSDVSLALSLRDTYPDHFAGYDLVGREDAGYPLIHFIQELLLPSQLNRSLPYFFHAGETDWEGTSIDENLIDALLLNTSRIGHGYAITKHPVAMAMALSQDTAIEVNPISNQVLGLVDDLRNHPAATLISQGFPVVISSDDPATWNAGQLSYDFYQAFMGLAGEQADLATLKQLAQDSIRYSAMSNSEKKAAMQLWQKKWDSFLDEILSSIK